MKRLRPSSPPPPFTTGSSSALTDGASKGGGKESQKNPKKREPDADERYAFRSINSTRSRKWEASEPFPRQESPKNPQRVLKNLRISKNLRMRMSK